jgi:hypothetical protein
VNNPLETTLADAAELLDRESIAYALVGGLAASIRGQPRATADVDMVIDADVARALKLSEALERTTFRPLFPQVSEVIERSLILPLRHRSTTVKVDLAIGLSGFEQQAIGRAERFDISGCAISLATAEDLIVMKVLAGRPQDEQDVRGIVVAQGNRLDWDYCLTSAKALGEAIGQDLVGPIRALRGE